MTIIIKLQFFVVTIINHRHFYDCSQLLIWISVFQKYYLDCVTSSIDSNYTCIFYVFCIHSFHTDNYG